VDNVWEQKKLEARKMLENAAESPASSAPFVSPLLTLRDVRFTFCEPTLSTPKIFTDKRTGITRRHHSHESQNKAIRRISLVCSAVC